MNTQSFYFVQFSKPHRYLLQNIKGELESILIYLHFLSWFRPNV